MNLDRGRALTVRLTESAIALNERLIRFKQFRRIATRYEKRAQNYLAMLTLAAILFWL
jgi:transposase